MKLFSIFNKPKNKQEYKCSCCGKVYDEIPLCFGSEFPDYYFSIPLNEREERIEKMESLFVVDKKHFFHRGRLIIPINNYPEDLIFNVWTSISEDNFRNRNDLWENPKRIEEKPYFGWFQSHIATYENTLNIQSIAIEQEVGIIPKIIITEENHKLKFDQENGISYEKAMKIVDEIMKIDHQK
jgi:hypothetical protein